MEIIVIQEILHLYCISHVYKEAVLILIYVCTIGMFDYDIRDNLWYSLTNLKKSYFHHVSIVCDTHEIPFHYVLCRGDNFAISRRDYLKLR